MLTTIEKVKELTGYDVSIDLVYQAQAIVEIFSGKQEETLDNPGDKEVLGKATAYQAAYMSKNYTTVFEQVALTGMSAPDGSMTFDVGLGSPYLAPLAALSLRGLSDRGSKSIKIGAMFGRTARVEWERE